MNDLEQDLLMAQAEVNQLREENASLREEILTWKYWVETLQSLLKTLEERGKLNG